MRLRRLNEHIGQQNWLAVGLDFLIVVAGVFIGLQLGNWNTARADRAAYQDALERYRAEVVTNLATLDEADEQSLVTLEFVSNAFDSLLSCDNSPEALEAVNRGINVIMGTSGLSLRSSALEELTSSPRLLARQGEDARKRFSDTAYYKSVFLREAEFIEVLPLDERTQNNPIIAVGPRARREVSYAGRDYSRPDRLLRLGVPVSEACGDDRLIKSFYTWERWQSALPAVSRILREQLESDLVWLEGQA